MSSLKTSELWSKWRTSCNSGRLVISYTLTAASYVINQSDCELDDISSLLLLPLLTSPSESDELELLSSSSLCNKDIYNVIFFTTMVLEQFISFKLRIVMIGNVLLEDALYISFCILNVQKTLIYWLTCKKSRNYLVLRAWRITVCCRFTGTTMINVFSFLK